MLLPLLLGVRGCGVGGGGRCGAVLGGGGNSGVGVRGRDGLGDDVVEFGNISALKLQKEGPHLWGEGGISSIRSSTVAERSELCRNAAALSGAAPLRRAREASKEGIVDLRVEETIGGQRNSVLTIAVDNAGKHRGGLVFIGIGVGCLCLEHKVGSEAVRQKLAEGAIGGLVVILMVGCKLLLLLLALLSIAAFIVGVEILIIVLVASTKGSAGGAGGSDGSLALLGGEEGGIHYVRGNSRATHAASSPSTEEGLSSSICRGAINNIASSSITPAADRIQKPKKLLGSASAKVHGSAVAVGVAVALSVQKNSGGFGGGGSSQVLQRQSGRRIAVAGGRVGSAKVAHGCGCCGGRGGGGRGRGVSSLKYHAGQIVDCELKL